jgi:hypothetical protein
MTKQIQSTKDECSKGRASFRSLVLRSLVLVWSLVLVIWSFASGLLVGSGKVCRLAVTWSRVNEPTRPQHPQARHSFRGRQSLRDCRPKPIPENYLRRFKPSARALRYGSCRWTFRGRATTAKSRECQVNRSGLIRDEQSARTGSGARHRLPCGTTTPPSRTPGLPVLAHPARFCRQWDCRRDWSNVASSAALPARQTISRVRPDRDMPVRWFHRLGDVAQ